MTKVIENTEVFNFKQFAVHQSNRVMKVGTDGILLGAWASHQNNDKILDIGTGTGLLALMMAQKHPQASIVGLDIDSDACSIAARNFQMSSWNDRLKVEQSSIQEYVYPDSGFGLIISNPPFFNRKDLYDQSARQGMRNSVKMPHGDLLRSVVNMLNPNGAFCLILPHLEGLRFVEMAAMYSLFPTHLLEVKPRDDKPAKRLLIKFQKNRKVLVKEELILHHEDESDTEAYLYMTKDYYKR